MNKINQEYQKIVGIFLNNDKMRSSDIYREMAKSGESASLVTVKRTLSKMAEEGILTVIGSGRSTSYDVSAIGRIFADIDIKQLAAEPDKRRGLTGFNFDLLPAIPSDIFTDDEIMALDKATDEYRKKTENLPPEIEKKELERLVIELSWKSSKIEGNTYTLLDTEKLILKNEEAAGHDKKETQMILNHKEAFYYIRDNAAQFKTVTRKNLEELHSIMVKGLEVDFGLRSKPVGITGSIYRPLDNIHQIIEAVEKMAAAVSRMNTPYAQALIALLGISYIQPFNDGNKRTSRLMTNALLLAHNCAPLSYRSVDEEEYRSAMLAFYEINTIIPLKKIFISQYEFAASNYAVK